MDMIERGLERAQRILGKAPVPVGGLDIVYFSNGALGEPLWINTNRVGIELARTNRVLYIEQPWCSILGLWRLRTVGAMWRRLQGFTVLPGGLCVYSPLDLLPTGRLGPRTASMSRSFTRRLIVHRVRKQMARLGFQRPILWLYHGEQYPFIGSFNERLVVYDCVDEYTTFPSVKTDAERARIQIMEERLLRSADIVFAVTQYLADRKRRLNPNTYLVPNAGDVAHFGRVHREILRVPEDISRIPRPRLGYIGALARHRINFDLVDYLARERPDWSFIMIGPVTDDAGDSVLPRRSNLHWLGPRDYEELPAYIAGFDACFLPYDVNSHLPDAVPLKFHEFLGTGKPFVCTAFPTLDQYDQVIPLARTRQEFLSHLQAVLENDSPEARGHRLKVAARNSWDHRIRRMTDLICEHLERIGR